MKGLSALTLAVALIPVVAQAHTEEQPSAVAYTLEDARSGAQLRAEADILMPIIFNPCGSSPAMAPVQERFAAMLHGITENRHKFDIVIVRADYDYQMSLVDIACPDFTAEQQADYDELNASVANSVMDRMDQLLAETAERGE